MPRVTVSTDEGVVVGVIHANGYDLSNHLARRDLSDQVLRAVRRAEALEEAERVDVAPPRPRRYDQDV